ncbi:MAG: bifunctional riboflavin kinase/FAD synthetase, partial [Burkholderiaceae bacterium]
QKLLAAEGQKCHQTVLSFEPHPRAFFQPDQAPLKILPFGTKVLHLQELGLEELAILKFNKELASMSPEAFIQKVLVETLNAKAVVVGEDFRFGSKRAGSVTTLQDMGNRLGFQVRAVASVRHQHDRVSSSLLRDVLQSANLLGYKDLTGRDYELSGRVSYGRQLGRTLGFPTLNLAMPERLAIAGIFAVEVFGLRASSPVMGVASLGRRPTVETQGRNLLEVYLFDWSEMVYGRRICVRLKSFIRAEQKFDDLETMRLQMLQDMDQARDFLQRTS